MVGMRAVKPMSLVLHWGERPNTIPNLRHCRRRASRQLSAKRPGGRSGSKDPFGGDRTRRIPCIMRGAYRSAFFDLVRIYCIS